MCLAIGSFVLLPSPLLLYPYRLFQKKLSLDRLLLAPVRGSGSGLPSKALTVSWCQQELQSDNMERFVRHEKVIGKKGLSIGGESLI